MKRINEIFCSIQGEGRYTGTPAVFVRFSGCNLKCPFCDTDHSSFVTMSDGEILEKASEFTPRHVVFTGGEPLLQLDETLVSLFKQHGWYIQVETNGTRPVPSGVDWVTCSPKEGLVLDEMDELKVVYLGQDLAVYDSLKATVRCLQPCSMMNTSEVIEYVKANPQWRLSVQMHKYLNVR